MLNSDNKLIFENEKGKFYTNDMTKNILSFAKPLKGYQCFFVELNIGVNEYILVDDKNEIIYSSQIAEHIAAKLEIIKMI